MGGAGGAAGAAAGVGGRRRAWRVTSPRAALSRSSPGGRNGRGDASPFQPRSTIESRQNFRPAVPLTLQGVEVGGRPLGVMCDVLAGQDEVRRGSDGPAGLLSGAVQPHVPHYRPAAVRAQSLGEYTPLMPLPAMSLISGTNRALSWLFKAKQL
ncbi:unnamed protein product [Diatraea saccharalis]|uniref:Uncharacterized protein n=1 Tax=Diatraea saccharalis TaxID=40085 RepID=A0A9N9MYV0_9NEOP|nr:unnamed protein product [Diatraea saccharalis]